MNTIKCFFVRACVCARALVCVCRCMCMFVINGFGYTIFTFTFLFTHSTPCDLLAVWDPLIPGRLDHLSSNNLHSCKDFTPNTYSQFTHARYLRVAWHLNCHGHSSSNRRSTTLSVPRKIKSLLLQKDCLNKGRRCSVQYFLCIDRIM